MNWLCQRVFQAAGGRGRNLFSWAYNTWLQKYCFCFPLLSTEGKEGIPRNQNCIRKIFKYTKSAINPYRNKTKLKYRCIGRSYWSFTVTCGGLWSQWRDQQHTSFQNNRHVGSHVQSLLELLEGLPLASDGLGYFCMICKIPLFCTSYIEEVHSLTSSRNQAIELHLSSQPS